MTSATHDINDVQWWGASPERIEWLHEQVARQPFASAWAAVLLKQIQQTKETEDMKMTDMFPSKFLTGTGLTAIASTGQILVELGKVAREKMRAGANMPEETESVVYFEVIDPKTDKPRRVLGLEYHNGAGYGRVLNKTLAEQIFSATKTTDTDEWKGKRVVFYAADTKAGGEVTKTVCARAPKVQPKPTEQAAPVEQPAHDEPAAQAVIESALAQPPQ